MNRKIAARFSTLIEAQAAVTCLEAAGMNATVDNAIAGGMLPHASNALGGFTVSVDEDQVDEAKRLLELNSEPEAAVDPGTPASAEDKLVRRFKRAVYTAVLGTIFLPVIANLYSLVQIAAVCRQSAKVIADHKVLLLIALFFNCLGFAIGFTVLASWTKLAH